MPFLYPPAVLPQNRLVASLAADGSDVRYLVVYDGTHGDVALSHVSGERAEGHDFELWMIEGKNPPVSMGVIPVGATTHIPIKPEASKKLDAGAVLAGQPRAQGRLADRPAHRSGRRCRRPEKHLASTIHAPAPQAKPAFAFLLQFSCAKNSLLPIRDTACC